MLFSIDDLEHPIDHVPHQHEFDACVRRLTDEQYMAIIDELNSRIEGTEVQTSSWMPGRNWRGTVFWPIYDSACRRNEEAAALFFGQIVWKVFMDREDDWSFGRYEKDRVPIRGLTYFRINRRR